MSRWERYEGILAILFSAFVTGGATQAASRAYVAVRTFEGRAQMLRAATEAYFAEFPDDELQSEFKIILTNATCFSARRNDIAHGVVDHYIPKQWVDAMALDYAYALYPSYASFKERDLANWPTYCMSSLDVDYFGDEFLRLNSPAATLAGRIISRALEKPSRDKFPLPFGG
ncbi:hypothetical protein LGH82_24820 [Mesorhizobium sp. PAMC28654]|uniref:hypothetical protein n=1 Tax=Mesorhizobium sp. PAMC28654 TaxID=2880934 RepID=UPI001D09D017|nr:hypothetical protein [Mesorhizobium sp. PAMC28654]UDL88333.1 hypothetical protein LGH82_24820 [Mesorhizobium sp. PAMC28654]